MDAKLMTPFVDAMFLILPQVGIQSVQKGGIKLKEKLVASMNVTALVGLTKKVRGNVAYAMSEETAKKIASIMMMGMPVKTFDAMAQSAISELSNMLTANVAIMLEKNGYDVDISPPTLVVGNNVFVRVSSVKTLAIEIITEAGVIEINIGLEV